MTLHNSIKDKLQSGWALDKLRAHYDWISEQNLAAVIRNCQREIDAETAN